MKIVERGLLDSKSGFQGAKMGVQRWVGFMVQPQNINEENPKHKGKGPPVIYEADQLCCAVTS